MVLYLLAWIVTFGWYQYKNRHADAGSAIMLTYILYAIVSILSLNDPIFSSTYEPLTLFPFIYLYVMLMTALSPTIYNHLYPAHTINSPHTHILSIIAVIFIFCAIVQIPNIITNFNTGIVKLFLDNDAGKDAYMETAKEASDAGSNISNIPSIIFNALSDISIFLCFYFLSKKEKNPWLITGMLISIIIGLLIPVMRGQRSGVIMSLLTVILGYMLFRRYLSSIINRCVQIIGLSIIIATALPITAITLSRFESRSEGIAGFLTWYVGQANIYFNNYALDAGGIRNGDRTINLAKRIINPEDTPNNYVERREMYHNLEIDDYYFTTFVGDFCIDFGPVATVFIFVIFNAFVLMQIRPRDGTIELHQLLLLYFTMCICMQGGMYLFNYSDTANLQIITFGCLYAYLRYHNCLLEHFPKT